MLEKVSLVKKLEKVSLVNKATADKLQYKVRTFDINNRQIDSEQIGIKKKEKD
jgi:hypothetical protein